MSLLDSGDETSPGSPFARLDPSAVARWIQLHAGQAGSLIGGEMSRAMAAMRSLASSAPTAGSQMSGPPAAAPPSTGAPPGPQAAAGGPTVDEIVVTAPRRAPDVQGAHSGLWDGLGHFFGHEVPEGFHAYVAQPIRNGLHTLEGGDGRYYEALGFKSPDEPSQARATAQQLGIQGTRFPDDRAALRGRAPPASGPPIGSSPRGITEDQLKAFEAYMADPRIEKREPYVYRDSRQILTAGIGHKVLPKDHLQEGQRVSPEQISQFFRADGGKALSAARAQAAEAGITDPRFLFPLASVNFQLGSGWTQEHRKTWRHILNGEYEAAAEEAARSKWYEQTPRRVRYLQDALRALPPKPSGTP